MLRFARLDSLENGALFSLTQTLPGVPSPSVTEPAQNESFSPALPTQWPWLIISAITPSHPSP